MMVKVGCHAVLSINIFQCLINKHISIIISGSEIIIYNVYKFKIIIIGNLNKLLLLNIIQWNILLFTVIKKIYFINSQY